MIRPLLFCFALFIPALSAQTLNLQNKKNSLPEIGVVAAHAISIDKEKTIGDVLMRQLRGQAPIITDPLLEEYIQDLGNRLVAQAENVKFPFQFFLINNKDINAFAFFGGHIAVHTGLILNADTESELASVLAHEVAHVTQRHLARRIDAQQRSTPLQIASLFGGLLLAMASPEAGIATIQAGSAAAAQSQINYTRSNEQEADRIGLQVMHKAGYDPQGAVNFFAKLAEKYRMKSKPPAFLLTHPLPESRIADARAGVTQLPQRHTSGNLNFQLAKARVEARYGFTPEVNLHNFNKQLQSSSAERVAAARYGLALTYLAQKEINKAKQINDELLASDPENLFYIDLATDISLEQKDFEQAITRLEHQNKRTPRNRVVALNHANAAIQAGQYEDATAILKDYLLVNPEHFLSYQLLSDAYGESKQMLEMHQTKAEIYAMLAHYPRAIDELHSAYNYADDRKLEKQRIRARIEQFREAQQKLKAL